MSNKPDQKDPIYLYTDGACSGNPGPGGYGAILQYRGKEKILAQGYERTTNNRMELKAVIAGLEELKTPGWQVIVVTDSKYVSDAFNLKWIYGWVKKGWKNVKNPDLWQQLYSLTRKHNVSFTWVKGHAGHIQNERCDQLAVKASLLKNLPIDEGYERTIGILL